MSSHASILARSPCHAKTKTTRTDRQWNCMGILTTKELKKTHSSRPVGGVEMGSQTQGRAVDGRPTKAVAGGASGPTFACR